MWNEILFARVFRKINCHVDVFHLRKIIYVRDYYLKWYKLKKNYLLFFPLQQPI